MQRIKARLESHLQTSPPAAARPCAGAAPAPYFAPPAAPAVHEGSEKVGSGPASHAPPAGSDASPADRARPGLAASGAAAAALAAAPADAATPPPPARHGWEELEALLRSGEEGLPLPARPGGGDSAAAACGDAAGPERAAAPAPAPAPAGSRAAWTDDTKACCEQSCTPGGRGARVRGASGGPGGANPEGRVQELFEWEERLGDRAAQARPAPPARAWRRSCWHRAPRAPR
jgi:hypothetical protein